MRAVQATLLVLAIVEITLGVLAAKTAHLASPRTRIASLCLLVISITWVVVARMHPICVASPFLLIGLSLAHMQWWPMLLSLVVIPIHIVRGRREAAVLREAFVEESIAFALGLGSSCFSLCQPSSWIEPSTWFVSANRTPWVVRTTRRTVPNALRATIPTPTEYRTSRPNAAELPTAPFQVRHAKVRA